MSSDLGPRVSATSRESQLALGPIHDVRNEIRMALINDFDKVQLGDRPSRGVWHLYELDISLRQLGQEWYARSHRLESAPKMRPDLQCVSSARLDIIPVAPVDDASAGVCVVLHENN